MSWFNAMRHKISHRDNHGKEERPPPFPTLSTFLGLAAVMLVLWLLACGPPHFLSASNHPVPSNNTEAGASK